MIDSARPARSRVEVAALAACAACFALFCANVLVGWSGRALGWDVSWRLERVPEFLLLFGSTIAFAVASLAAELRDHARNERDPPPR